MNTRPDLRIAPVVAGEADVSRVLMRHHADMRASSPIESCHVQTVDELIRDAARVFACRAGGEVLGVGAYKPLSAELAELKSMHTLSEARGRGVGKAILLAILDAARRAGHRRIALETGSAPHFTAARALYAAHGFAPCPPFGDYSVDPLSVFMSRHL